jgi:hypothetical protein
VSPSPEDGGGIQEGCTRETETEGGGVKVDDDGDKVDDDKFEEQDGGGVLQVGDEVAVHSETGVEAVACSKVEDKAVACSGAAIEDGKQRHDGV